MNDFVANLVKSDPLRWHILSVVESLELETACIGAGFVRNLVWDHLHGKQNNCRENDIDVLWFDAEHIDPKIDRDLEQNLLADHPDFDWSVKNQARMHIRNGDAPYTDVADAMRFWPETATAIAARKVGDRCELIAPFGFDDLLKMIVRPTSSAAHKLEAFKTRVSRKDWRSRWPQVSIQTS